jgi:hypothetical protein
MNFPAYILSNDVEDLVSWRSMPGFQFTIMDSARQLPVLYNFGLRDVVFFLGVGVLWFWVGTKADMLAKVSLDAIPRWWRVGEMVVVLALGIWFVHACGPCLPAKSCAPPVHTIMMFGLFWPILFFAAFCLSLKHELEFRTP